ncbi:MAG: glycosyl transferase, partial [Lachnospiraceae bacterium]|nr:glycosyl transferase [Lachnospiraceae bacterium]
MKVLILSCNTGGGHNAAGRAMVERIRYEGHEAKLLDIM